MHLDGKLRPRGMYIAGKPGVGKSSAIQQMAIADMKKGRGVAVIDPSNDLIKDILNHIPEHRLDDVIYFTTGNPVPIDFFSYRDEDERGVLTDFLIDAFDLEDAKISRPRLQRILGTLFDANENPRMPDRDRCTLLDVEHFLADKTRRDTILSYAPHRKANWAWLDSVKNPESKFESILERMSPYTEPGALRTIFQAKRPKVNIWDVIQNRKILLINLRETRRDWFIGALLMTKFQQAIFDTSDIEPEDRIPFYLYVDECNSVVKTAPDIFRALLLRARKFKLCITLANQLPSDLGDLLSAIRIVHYKLLLNLPEDEARFFKSEIENAPHQDSPELLAERQAISEKLACTPISRHS